MHPFDEFSKPFQKTHLRIRGPLDQHVKRLKSQRIEMLRVYVKNIFVYTLRPLCFI